MSRNFNTSKQYASSRRVRIEEKKLTKQIIFFLLLAVALLAGFILVVIPNLMKFLANLSGNTPTQTENVPVQVPFLSAPVAATSSANLKLSGFSQKGYIVAIVDNGQELSKQTASDDGSFSADVTLTQGDNKLTVYAIDQSNHQSEVSQEYSIVFDDQPPILDILEPTDKQNIQGKQNQNLTIKGQTDVKTKVYINDRLIFVKDDGSFSTTQPLQDGDNTLNLKAIDQAGNKTEKVLTVTFHS